MRVGLGPDDEDARNRRVGDPHLGAGEAIAAVDLLRARPHGAGVRPRIRLGKPEAADPFAGRQLGQILLLLSLGAIGMDGMHDERSEEHTSELKSLMRISYAVFCLKKKRQSHTKNKKDRHVVKY